MQEKHVANSGFPLQIFALEVDALFIAKLHPTLKIKLEFIESPCLLIWIITQACCKLSRVGHPMCQMPPDQSANGTEIPCPELGCKSSLTGHFITILVHVLKGGCVKINIKANLPQTVKIIKSKQQAPHCLQIL